MDSARQAQADETKFIQFPKGKIVGARWMIKKTLGMGAYGIVYEVQNVNDPLISGALKAESNSTVESILKIEVEVLKQLQNRKYTVRLLYSGKRETYSYLVMTLCGPDLTSLKQNNRLSSFSESTILRIAILSLYAIKQLHEIGYVHRDIKPSNLAIAINDRHIMYLLDYGLARKYAVLSDKKWFIRKPRQKTLLRGTLRYCSVNTHKRLEQGRVDDLWSLMYALIDLRTNSLPWGKITREDGILYQKESISDKQLLADGNLEYYEKILAHLRQLNYPDRPDYLYMYKMMLLPMMRKRYTFHEPYDWELASEGGTQEESTGRSSRKAQSISKSNTMSPKANNGQTVPADIPVAQMEAFREQEDDVPDISKTDFIVSHRRSLRKSQPDEGASDEQLP